MSLPEQISSFIQVSAILLALLTLTSMRPKLSALFLFLEAIVIAIILGSEAISATFFIGALLLTIISLILVASNTYLESTHFDSAIRIPKINLILGSIAVIFFFMNADKICFTSSIYAPPSSWLVIKEGLTIITLGFAIFVVLISALSVLEIRTSHKRGRYEP